MPHYPILTFHRYDRYKNAHAAWALRWDSASLFRSDDIMPRRLKIHKLVANVAAVFGAMTETAGALESQTVTHESSNAVLIRQSLDTFSNQGEILPIYSPLINGFDIASFINSDVGVISGSFVALLNEGTIGTLSNAGIIGVRAPFSVSPEIGISNAGNIGSLINTGAIIGSETGIFNPSRIGSIVNQGAIGLANATAAGLANHGIVRSIRNEGTMLATSTALWNVGTILSFENASAIHGEEVGVANAFLTPTLPGVSRENRTLGTIRSLTNEAPGTLSGGIAGLWNGAWIQAINNGGVITGAIALSNHRKGTIDFIVNDGQLTGQEAALRNAGTIGSVENIGAMDGGKAVFNKGSIRRFSNHGSGKGLMVGIDNVGVIERLLNHGTISAGVNAIENRGRIGSLENTGFIIDGGIAISNDGGAIGSINNSGVITARNTGIENADYHYEQDRESGIDLSVLNLDGPRPPTRAARLGNVINSGMIAAQVAIYTDGSIGTITNVGLIMGDISNLSAYDLNIVGGNGNNVGILSGYPGEDALAAMGEGHGRNAAAVGGMLRSPQANVNFIAGNTLLYNNVDLAHSGTLSLRAGTLKLNEAIFVSGSYRQSAGSTLSIGVQDSVIATGQATDIDYGQLMMSGIATIQAGATISLYRTAAYAFAPGQRFAVVDAETSSADGDTQYNADALQYTVVDAAGVRASGASVVSEDGHRTSLVVSLAVSDAGVGPGAGETNDAAEGAAQPWGAASPGAGIGDTGAGGINARGTNARGTNVAAGALRGLGAYTGISKAALLNLYNAGQAVRLLSRAETRRAQDRLSPLSQTMILRAAMSPTYDTMRLVGLRMDQVRLDQLRLRREIAARGHMGADGGLESRDALWIQALGGHARQGQRDNVAGYSANFGGVMLGADTVIDDQWHAGGAFSYSNTGVNHRDSLSGSTTQVKGYGLFGYARYAASAWYANVLAGVVHQHYKQTRRIDFIGFSGSASGSFGGSHLVARGELGYPLALGASTFTPIAGLTFAYMRQNGYTESGGNGAALSVDAAHATSIQSDLGAKIERAYTSHYGVLISSVQVAWRHEYDHQKTSIAAQFAADPLGETRFTTQGATPVSDSAVLSAELTLLQANNLSVTAQYTVQAGKGYLSQAGAVKLRQLF